MGLFDKFKKSSLKPLQTDDQAIVAMADGNLIDVSTVPDDVFAQKMMGDSVAFQYDGDDVIICSPANGELTMLFPTGHAFGVKMKNGIELMVHIGINTVEANGDGFTILHHKQGDTIRAGDPVIKVNLKKLRQKYNMSTMLIVTNANNQTVRFTSPRAVKRGDTAAEVN